MVPVLARVPGDAHAVVVAEQHVLRVARIDPQSVVVAAEAERRGPGLPAVGRVRHADGQHVDMVRIVRVDPHLHVVVARSAADGLLLRAHLPPGLSAIVGPIDLFADHAFARLAVSQFLEPGGVRHPRLVAVFDVGVEDQRILRVDVEADAAEHPAGEALGEFRPGLAGVDRLVDGAAGAGQVEGPRLPLLVVGGGVEDLRVPGIDDQVRRADRPFTVLHVERLGPCLAAVGRLEDAPLGVPGVEVTEGGDVHRVGELRIDDDAADVVRVLQPHVRPGLAAVGRLVDTVAPVGAARGGRLAGADPHDVWIRGSHGDVTDRDDRLVVEDRRPRNAVVDRLPEPARAGRGVDGGLILFGNGEVDEPAALPAGTNRPERERLEHFRCERLRRDVGGDQQQGERNRARGAQPSQRTSPSHQPAPCHWMIATSPTRSGTANRNKTPGGRVRRPLCA